MMGEQVLVITVIPRRVGACYTSDIRLSERSREVRLEGVVFPVEYAPTRQEAIESTIEWVSEMIPLLVPDRDWRIEVPVFCAN
jgi:hypothetical protein